MSDPDPDFVAASVFTVPEVADGTRPVTYVYRQQGTGLWFLLPAPMAAGEAQGDLLVAMRDLLARDPTLAKLSNMPPGMGAMREHPQAPWMPFKVHQRTLQTTTERLEKRRYEVRDQESRASRRRLGIANRASALLMVMGTLLLLFGGLLMIGLRQPAFAGVAANWAFGVPPAVVGLLLVVCGLVVGRTLRPGAAILGAFALTLVAAGPLLWGGADPAGWLGRWRDLCAGFEPAAARPLLAMEWHGLRPGMGLLWLVALVGWSLALALSVAGRSATREQAAATG